MPNPRPLHEHLESERTCSYLPAERARLEYRLYRSLSPEDLETLIERGWRRFGPALFRPQCSACLKCIPLRVVVSELKLTKSQRRTLRKNQDVHVELHRASLSADHLRLYNEWHRDMHERRDWPHNVADAEHYFQSFLAGDFPSAHELRYFRGQQLIGVGLIDLLPHSISSIYFYHAPEWRSDGPGTFSMLQELELVRRLGLDYLYLGYWISECPSMAYKNRFHPYEVLESRPEETEAPPWRRDETPPEIDPPSPSNS